VDLGKNRLQFENIGRKPNEKIYTIFYFRILKIEKKEVDLVLERMVQYKNYMKIVGKLKLKK